MRRSTDTVHTGLHCGRRPPSSTVIWDYGARKGWRASIIPAGRDRRYNSNSQTSWMGFLFQKISPKFLFSFIFSLPGSRPGHTVVVRSQVKRRLGQSKQRPLRDSLHWPHADHRVEWSWGLAGAAHKALWKPVHAPGLFVTALRHRGAGFQI